MLNGLAYKRSSSECPCSAHDDCCPRLLHRQVAAEHLNELLLPNSVDLITAAETLHWCGWQAQATACGKRSFGCSASRLTVIPAGWVFA